MQRNTNKIIVREIWDDSDDGFDSDEYEDKQIHREMEQENLKNVEEYNECQNLIYAICNDMKAKDPKLNDDLNKLMIRLDVSSQLVDKLQKGGNKQNYPDRLSAIALEDRLPSKQARFTKEEIATRLKNYTRVTVKELFQLPNGSFVRYFKKNENGRKGKYVTGGIMFYKDPEERFVTVKAYHNARNGGGSALSWNIQMSTLHSVYVTTKNVKTYRLQKIDKKYKMRKGTANMLNKWMIYDPILVDLAQRRDKSVAYVVYDITKNRLISPSKLLRTNMSVLDSIGMDENTFKQLVMGGLKDQIINPHDGTYLVGMILKKNVPKLKKMKSRLKPF
jgi:hypothetical protein